MASDRRRKASEDDENAVSEDAENERPAVDRSYMLTWGNSLANKREFAEKAAKDREEVDPVAVEEERMGVNPVISPNVDADGNPVHE